MTVRLRIKRRRGLSHEKSDLDEAITQLTEAVHLPCQLSEEVAVMIFELASAHLSRFPLSRQPDDIKTSVKYFRFLRINSHSLEVFDIPHHEISSHLFHALAHNLDLVPGDIVQDLEEMVALMPDFITTDFLTTQQMHATAAFADAIADTDILRRKDTQRVLDRVIEALRDVTVLNPDLGFSYLLASCLGVRAETTHMIKDYDEAIALADKIVPTHFPGDSLTELQRRSILSISSLLVSRLNSHSSPEYFMDAIRRIHTFFSLPSLPDKDRAELKAVLDVLKQRRFNYFGISGNSRKTPPNLRFALRPIFILRARPDSQESVLRSPMLEKEHRLRKILVAIINGEIADVKAAVERSRKLLPLQRSSDHYSCTITNHFADILFHAHLCTKRSHYLDEAIVTYRGVRKLSGPKVICFQAGYMLLQSLIERFLVTRSFLAWSLIRRSFLTRFSWFKFCLQQDFEESMQLFPEVANDGSGEVFTRFKVSSAWAWNARVNMHSSTSVAYDTAMSLLQETLVFSPTLQTKHLRLAHAFRDGGGLPFDYASYQIENGRIEQAIETLERGRALLWSELRGLRVYTDPLRAAYPTLAEKFADINQRLESVTMSVARSDDETKDVTRTGHQEDSISHLVPTQQRLLEQRNSLITHIQSLSGFENFLKLLSSDVLSSVAAHGPVIIINQSEFPSHILLLLKDSPPSVISTPPNFHDRANRLKNELLQVRKKKGLDSDEYGLTLAYVLTELYELVGKPVIERLRQSKVPKNSRVWWCPTGAFCSLPLHAMGPIPSRDGNVRYFSDLYIPSYTPTLSALIESRKPRSLPKTFDNLKPSILLVAQPNSLDGVDDEIEAIESTSTPVTILRSEMATSETVLEGLRDHRFAHFACHGLLETGRPFDASLELHGDNLTLLDIVRSQLSDAEFAFLSACHTAELTEDSVADEGLHLTAAMQFCGFRSVVGTMWAMADIDGAALSQQFYKRIFSDKADQNGVPYYERSAQALQFAVKKLRGKQGRKQGVTLERWVNFVHYGA